MRVGWALWLGLVGCGGEAEDSDDPEDTDRGGACGDVTEHDLHLVGLVVADGAPVAGADVRLEERVWHTPTLVFGSSLTAADGTFAFSAPGVVSVEDCWGTALDYVVVGVRGDDVAEDSVNSSLYGAITDGDTVVDLTAFPLEL